MKIISGLERALKALLPSPFSLALFLTLFVFILAFIFGNESQNSMSQLGDYWQKGLFEPNLLAFLVQMMLMLVLGHVLALTPLVDRFLTRITVYCNSTARAAFIVSFFTLCLALFNWGMGLIFGAVFARKVGEHALRNGHKLNYPLIGAAGYSGFMVWHGGLSGSAPLKAAENGHLKQLMANTGSEELLASLPDRISLSETIFGSMNMLTSLLILFMVPTFLYLIGRRLPGSSIGIPEKKRGVISRVRAEGAERIDHVKYLGLFVGLLILIAMIGGVNWSSWRTMAFITPNFINLLLLALALMFHGKIVSFLGAVDEAISGASGILIQFPLYFGILGLMHHSGLIAVISDGLTSISSSSSFPLLALGSSGFVNIFVPSGGGQWAVQGPILIQSAYDLGVSLPKTIMALAYGDQLTNMLQPFWALPLLAITGLSARAILPFTLMLMGLGTLIFAAVLMLF